MNIATIGAGCFWCVEAIFQTVPGVDTVLSGYAGGETKNPTYEQICGGLTGHAEVVQIGYDPEILPYKELLSIFWKTHDPTTLNKQGADIGSQYRSIIFYHDKDQRKIAESLKDSLTKSGLFKSDIVTEIVKFEKFYLAEEYHQNYFKKNPNVPYCSYVIKPKVDKFLSNQK